MEDDQTLDMSKRYYYDGSEYYLTGRVAERIVKQEPRRSRRRRKDEDDVVNEHVEVMVEIAPVGAMKLPGATEGNLWVKTTDLFTIHDRINDDLEEG
jgi:hypothetical protein